MTARTVTTVTVAASTYDLTDLATAHDELNIPDGTTTDDGFIGRAITQASRAIANYCNRVFPAETVQDRIYALAEPDPWKLLDGRQVLQLARFPIIAITSVVQSFRDGTTETLVEGTDFITDANPGQLIRLNTQGLARDWHPRLITVIYQAGYTEIPDDLVDAALRLVTARFRARGRDPMLRSIDQQGLGTTQYWVGTTPGQNGALAPEIEALISNYRVPVIA